MEISELFSSTDETVQFSPRYERRGHFQTKTTDFSKRNRSFRNRKNQRNISKPFESSSTLIENQKISQSLNTHNLKLSLKSIYDKDPKAQLKQIFKAKHQQSPKFPNKEVQKNFSGDLPRRRRGKVDSIFQQNEADLIMEELKTIKSPEVWQKVVQKFKQKPSALMDLIPLE